MSDHGFRFSFLLLCIMVLTHAYVCFAGSYGGSGKINSPYADSTPTLNEVIQMRNTISKKRVINNIKLIGDNNYVYGIWNVALAYYNKDKLVGELKYSFDGYTVDGKPISIKLSDVEDFTRLKDDTEIYNGLAVFEVTVFPDLSPQQLMSTSIGYSDLRRKHEKKIKIYIPLNSTNNGQLYIVDLINKNAKPEVKVAEIAPEYKNNLNIHGGTAWWAIPSVVEDSSYPYRIEVKH